MAEYKPRTVKYGETYNGFTLLRFDKRAASNHYYFIFHCPAHNVEFSARLDDIQLGKRVGCTACTNMKMSHSQMGRVVNKPFKWSIGDVINRITVLRITGMTRGGYKVEAACFCGNIFETRVAAIIHGATTSCGCRTASIVGTAFLDMLESKLNVPIHREVWIGPRRYDGCILKAKVFIETDGTYWHSLPHAIINDEFKTQLVRGIPGAKLFRFSNIDDVKKIDQYYEIHKLQILELEDHLSGLTDGLKIYTTYNDHLVSQV